MRGRGGLGQAGGAGGGGGHLTALHPLCTLELQAGGGSPGTGLCMARARGTA